MIKVFGLKQFDLAEDIVQETLVDALNQWSVGKIPDNPSAWLVQVAKYKTINLLKKQQRASDYAIKKQLKIAEHTDNWDVFFQEASISDSQLQMIFTCCHPSLPVESQIALTLKTLCGFSVPEIAHTLLTNVANINKRLYRAKLKFRNEEIAFKLPAIELLADRLDAVYLTLYLLFNEGYNSSHSEILIREDLCVDAIRLLALVTEYYQDQPKAYALLALMYLHGARFNARLDKKGGIIIFEDQNRSQWDMEMIHTGIYFLRKASTGTELSVYHLEAGIAAEHCLASSFDQTNWKSIYKQYEMLYTLKPNPVVELNMAIISSQLHGLDEAISKLTKLEEQGALENYYLLAATLGHFYMQKKQYTRALNYLKKAITLTHSPAETNLIEQNIELSLHQLNNSPG